MSRDGHFMIQVTASSNCTARAEALLASKKAKAQRSSFASFPQGKQIGLKTTASETASALDLQLFESFIQACLRQAQPLQLAA